MQREDVLTGRIACTCGAREGELHEFDCDMERCPFCGLQLITCRCPFELLGLLEDVAPGWEAEMEVMEGGLDEDQMAQWVHILEQKRRVPFICYPVICARCGEFDPPLFCVADEEWQRYVEPAMRRAVLCPRCFDHIKMVVDRAARQNHEGKQPEMNSDLLVTDEAREGQEVQICASN